MFDYSQRSKEALKLAPMTEQDLEQAIARFPWLEGLNPEQARAVMTTDGPLLMLAGAGTGKTRALTTRIAHLLLTGQATAGQVLAVTFTNKAAFEMKERVQHLLKDPGAGWWMGTFHSIAVRILRRHGELVGLKSNFTILDDDDQERLLKQVMGTMDIDPKRWKPRAVLALISRWKDRALQPSALSASEQGDFADGKMLLLYKGYQERLMQINACDFGDLLLHCIRLFQEKNDILISYQRRFAYILVDEYQDTNVAQYLWLRLLAMGHKNLCCVGDDDQSIYGWRGAEVGNILKFEQDFPNAKVIRLEQNYRSTPAILGAASALIAYNQGRLGKTLWTDSSEGDLVQVRGLWDGEEEARFVGEAIEDEQRQGRALNQMAVLVRSSSLMRSFEERFVAIGLPYRVIGGPRFYERREIRDALAYLRVLHQPSDDMALERIINVPKRGIGPGSLQKLYAAAREMNLPLQRTIQSLLEQGGLRGAIAKNLTPLFDDIVRWRERMHSTPHPELAEIILDESGYTAMWQAERSIEAQGRLENLKELINAMAGFETLAAFLEHVSLIMEGLEGNVQDMVTIMTLHSAKGLEFEVTFLPGWEQGMFPNQRALDETGVKGLEEERRLAYVGITRARQKLFISYAGRRRLYGQYQDCIASQFLDELPDEYINVQSTASNWSNTWSGQSADDYRGGFGSVSSYADTPGWRRAHSYQKVAEGRAMGNPQTRAMARVLSFKVGDRVFHEKFGYGNVDEADGDSIFVSFDTSNQKRIKAGFLQLLSED